MCSCYFQFFLSLLSEFCLLWQLLRLGVNLKGFPTKAIPATFAILFHVGIGAVLFLYVLFWLKVSIAIITHLKLHSWAKLIAIFFIFILSLTFYLSSGCSWIYSKHWTYLVSWEFFLCSPDMESFPLCLQHQPSWNLPKMKEEFFLYKQICLWYFNSIL